MHVAKRLLASAEVRQRLNPGTYDLGADLLIGVRQAVVEQLHKLVGQRLYPRVELWQRLVKALHRPRKTLLDHVRGCVPVSAEDIRQAAHLLSALLRKATERSGSAELRAVAEIGRASCRDRVCQYV